MSTYYKYAEQSADSQVNWAEVGKSVSDMLKEEMRLREEKKKAYDESFQKDTQELTNAPQGKWQDGNKFTNDVAHDVMQQQLIDYRLLKSGQMSPQDYTLRRQNIKNGVNTLFDLQKSYQDVYDDRMQGLLSGKYQAMTGAEMAQVEGFKDFSNSRGVINPYTGILSVGKMAPNPKTGVMELTKDVIPVNVLKGKINTPIPAWDADGSINGIVDKMGENVDVLYKAASTMKAGTITEVLGLGALEGEYAKKDKNGNPLYPQFKDSIDNINKGINDAISSAFSNPYNISSVLTQNTGKYNQQSFTYDKDVAANDKSKILLKIDATTGLSTLDKEAPNYKSQEQEARDWVRGQMLSKMDAKRKITTTSPTPFAPQPTSAQLEITAGRKAAAKDARVLANLYSGSPSDLTKAVTYFRDTHPELLITDIERTPAGVNVTIKGEDNSFDTRLIPFKSEQTGQLLNQEQFIEEASKLLSPYSQYMSDVLSGGGYRGGKFNNIGTAKASTKSTRGTSRAGLPAAPMTQKYLLGGSASTTGGVGAKYN